MKKYLICSILVFFVGQSLASSDSTKTTGLEKQEMKAPKPAEKQPPVVVYLPPPKSEHQWTNPLPTGNAQIIFGSIIAGFGAYIFTVATVISVDVDSYSDVNSRNSERQLRNNVFTLGTGAIALGTGLMAIGLDKKLARKNWGIEFSKDYKKVSWNYNF